MKYFSIFILLLFSVNAFAQSPFNKTPTFLKVTQAYQALVSQTDKSFKVQWSMSDGYYLYADKFKIRVDGKQIDVNFSRSGKWIYDEYFEMDKEVFYDSLGVTGKLSSSVVDTVELDFQGCADLGLCYPPETYYYQLQDSVFEQISPASFQKLSVKNTVSELSGSMTFAIAILFALIGGIILNLMPCVFPVLSIKAIGLATSSDVNKHGWVYSLGVVLSFVVIASILIALRITGNSVGWGFQLQSPLFIVGLLILFFVMSLSLLGFLEVGTALMGLGQQLTQKRGYQGSFFTGLLAVTVATPCTAPFMASALGYAIAEPPLKGLLVFVFLGVGMALPMLLLTQFPALIKRLPRSGNWLLYFKQFMAFPMLLTCVWLLWVFANQRGNTAAMLLLTMLTMIGLITWLKMIKGGKTLLIVTAVLALWIGYQALVLPVTKTTQKESFRLAQLDGLTGGDAPVLVDVTASWCMTCLVNERVALSNSGVEQAFEQANVKVVVADWTNPNAEIEQLLQRYNRVGIPLYLWFPKYSKNAQLLPQILTPQLLINLVQNEF